MGLLKGKIMRLNTFSKARSEKQACVNVAGSWKRVVGWIGAWVHTLKLSWLAYFYTFSKNLVGELEGLFPFSKWCLLTLSEDISFPVLNTQPTICNSQQMNSTACMCVTWLIISSQGTTTTTISPATPNQEGRRELTDLSVVFPVKMALAFALVSGKDFMYESYKCFARARRSADSGFSWSISLEISANSFSFSACGIRPNLMAIGDEKDRTNHWSTAALHAHCSPTAVVPTEEKAPPPLRQSQVLVSIYNFAHDFISQQ